LTKQHSLLDIVLTNEPLIVSNVGVEAPLSNSDYCQVNFSITVKTPAKTHGKEWIKQYL